MRSVHADDRPTRRKTSATSSLVRPVVPFPLLAFLLSCPPCEESGLETGTITGVIVLLAVGTRERPNGTHMRRRAARDAPRAHGRARGDMGMQEC